MHHLILDKTTRRGYATIMLMDAPASLRQALWRLIRPDISEFIAYLLVAAGLFAFSLYQAASAGLIGTESKDLVTSFNEIVRSALVITRDGDTWARVFLFGFWFLLGTFAYFAIWFTINLLVDAYNNILISAAFVHPRSFHQSDYWLAVTGRAIVRLSALIALVFYTLFWVLILAPVWQDNFNAVIVAPASRTGLIALGTTLAGIAVSLHIGTILLRLVVLRSR